MDEQLCWSLRLYAKFRTGGFLQRWPCDSKRRRGEWGFYACEQEER